MDRINKGFKDLADSVRDSISRHLESANIPEADKRELMSVVEEAIYMGESFTLLQPTTELAKRYLGSILIVVSALINSMKLGPEALEDMVTMSMVTAEALENGMRIATVTKPESRKRVTH